MFFQNVTHSFLISTIIKSGVKRGIKVAKFDASIIDSELPIDFGSKRVAGLKPSLNRVTEQITRRKTLAETLAFENTEFNFSHVEPTAMNGGVVESDAID